MEQTAGAGFRERCGYVRGGWVDDLHTGVRVGDLDAKDLRQRFARGFKIARNQCNVSQSYDSAAVNRLSARSVARRAD